jgi:hypothetical protein
MSKSFIGELTAELSQVQKAGAVPGTHSGPGRVTSKPKLPNPKKKILNPKKSKPRFGLPEGFRPRMQQFGRSLLLEDNIYVLSGGREFIPKYPTGTLGQLSHLYALLTVEQFQQGRRGSVYIRSDGRIFDYSVDHADPSRDMFDTGYTIYDLKRTGRYAPQDKLEKKQKEDLQLRKLAQAG